jgi:hypothetical protein
MEPAPVSRYWAFVPMIWTPVTSFSARVTGPRVIAIGATALACEASRWIAWSSRRPRSLRLRISHHSSRP